MTIALLNMLTLFFILLSLGIILLQRYQKFIPHDIFFILLAFFCLLLFKHTSNVLEWSGIETRLDVIEDFLQVLETIFFGILIYALLQHHLHHQILTSEAKYRLLVENQTDLVIKIDPDGHLLFVSPSYCRMFGKSEKELLGRSFLPAVHHEDLEMTRQEMEKLSSPPYSCLFRQRVCTKFGWRHLAWAYRAIPDKTGKTDAIVCMGRDITDQVEAEEGREKLLEKLEAKNKELQSLLCISSHDLQSPLVNIRGFSGELKNSCLQLKQILNEAGLSSLTERINSLLEDIQQALYFIDMGAEKMQNLIEGLLKLSRIGSVELILQPLHMNALIRSIVESMHYQIQQSGSTVVIEDLPSCQSDLYQVSQVFSNLLDNAVKYLDHSRPGEIRITGEEKNGFCEYRVTDNGIGIDPEHHTKIFEIFHRLYPGGPVKGLGLGLAIVLRILDKLDGTIRVTSDRENGTTFIVTLPAVPDDLKAQ